MEDIEVKLKYLILYFMIVYFVNDILIIFLFIFFGKDIFIFILIMYISNILF